MAAVISRSSTVVGLTKALQVLSREAAGHPEQADLQLARSVVADALAAATIRDHPRSVAQVANLAGISAEAMRRRIHRLFPQAKVRGRLVITRTMLPALLGEQNPPDHHTKITEDSTMGRVLQFPRERDRTFIFRQATWLSELPMATAEKQLARQIQVQRETMARRGILPAAIEAHARQVEAAIRDAMWQLRSASGGAA